MIHIAVTAVASGAHALVNGAQLSVVGQVLTIPPCLLTAVEMEETGMIDIQGGLKPEMDNRSWGELRDKGVKHLNATGDLQCTLNSYQYDLNNGYPRVMRTNGTLLSYSAYVTWGMAFREVKDFGPVTWTASGRIYTVQYYRNERAFYWCDKGLITWSRWTKAATIRDDGVQTGAAGNVGSTTVTTYRRQNTAIYRMAIYSVTGEPSGSYLATLGEGIPQTGGTSVAIYTDLVLQGNGTTDQLIETFKQRIGTQWSRLAPYLKKHPTDFGDLAIECSKQLRYVDSNILLFVLDVNDWRQFHKMWKTFINLKGWKRAVSAYKKIKRGRGDRKSFADFFNPASSVYLFTKYAVLPSVSDVGRLSAGVQRSSLFLTKQRLHSRRITPLSIPDTQYSSHTAVLTAVVDEYPSHITGKIQEFISESKRWGAFPELVNLWDLLPYSFCADWFVQFGDLFEDVNTYMDQKWYFPVEYVIHSERWEFGIPSTVLMPEFSVTGVVKFSYYVRWITKEVPLPSISLETESTVGNHLLESTALVLQRL